MLGCRRQRCLMAMFMNHKVAQCREPFQSLCMPLDSGMGMCRCIDQPGKALFIGRLGPASDPAVDLIINRDKL